MLFYVIFISDVAAKSIVCRFILYIYIKYTPVLIEQGYILLLHKSSTPKFG